MKDSTEKIKNFNTLHGRCNNSLLRFYFLLDYALMLTTNVFEFLLSHINVEDHDRLTFLQGITAISVYETGTRYALIMYKS